MKKVNRTQRDRDMLEEYDFSKGIRGKYAKRFTQDGNVEVPSSLRRRVHGSSGLRRLRWS